MAQENELEELHAVSVFDATWYVKEYPDVARSGLEPAAHYMKLGRRLGRRPCAKGDEHGLNVRHLIAKEMSLSPGDEVALLVTHAPSGRLKPHVLPYMKQLQGAGLLVLLVVVVDRPVEMLDEEIATADGIIVRDNAGYDFGAWAHGFRLVPSLFDVNLLIMTNDSVIPTADSAVFGAMMDRLRSSQEDIVALTSNHDFGWHVQSYFLGIKRSALSHLAFKDFIYSIRRIDDKDEVVKTYEIPFAMRMKEAGLRVRSLFFGPYPDNPTMCSWRELISDGFPFIKLILLKKNVFSVIKGRMEILNELHRDWPEVCGGAGFDVDVIRRAVRSAEMIDPIKSYSNNLVVDINSFSR